MNNGCGSGKAIDIKGPQPVGAHAEAAHVEVVVDEPGVPTKGRIFSLENGERAAVEVGHIIVDSLLPELI